jgi:hypothetical protein
MALGHCSVITPTPVIPDYFDARMRGTFVNALLRGGCGLLCDLRGRGFTPTLSTTSARIALRLSLGLDDRLGDSLGLGRCNSFGDGLGLGCNGSLGLPCGLAGSLGGNGLPGTASLPGRLGSGLGGLANDLSGPTGATP